MASHQSCLGLSSSTLSRIAEQRRLLATPIHESMELAAADRRLFQQIKLFFRHRLG